MSPEVIAEEMALAWDPDADRHDPDEWVTTWWCDACGEWVEELAEHTWHGGAA